MYSLDLRRMRFTGFAQLGLLESWNCVPAYDRTRGPQGKVLNLLQQPVFLFVRCLRVTCGNALSK